MSTDPAEKRSKGRRPPIPTPADISPPPPPPPPPRPEAPIAVPRPDAKQSKSSSAPQVSTPKSEETQAVGVLWPYAIAVMVVAFIGFAGGLSSSTSKSQHTKGRKRLRLSLASQLTSRNPYRRPHRLTHWHRLRLELKFPQRRSECTRRYHE